VKGNPGVGALRMMRLGVDAKTDEAGGDDSEEAGGETDACDGIKAGVGEQVAAVTVTVVGEIIRTVLMPSGPMVAATISSTLALGEVFTARVAEDKGADEGTIPPKLNVLVGSKEGLNWRRFSMMTEGEGTGVLRAMTGGKVPGALRLIMDGIGPGVLRAMTGEESPRCIS
jgi:hypothetical protein